MADTPRSLCEQILIDGGYPMTGKGRMVYVKEEKEKKWQEEVTHKTLVRDEDGNPLLDDKGEKKYTEEKEMVQRVKPAFLRVSILHPWKRHFDDDFRGELRALFLKPESDVGCHVQVDYKIGPDRYATDVPMNAVAHVVCGVSVEDWSEATPAERQKWLIA